MIMKTKEQILKQLGFSIDCGDKSKKMLFDNILSQAMDEFAKQEIQSAIDEMLPKEIKKFTDELDLNLSLEFIHRQLYNLNH